MNPIDNDSLILPLSDGKVIMGLYPVLFGWRCRAGNLSDKYTYHLDWCCGDSPFLVWSTYEILKCLLKHHDIRKLPRMSMVKPWPKDPEFSVTVVELMRGAVEPIQMVISSRPSLASLKEEYYKKNGLEGIDKLFKQ